MHHWSSRKHGIQRYLIIVGRQNLKTWSISMKKGLKSQKFRVVEVGNMYLTGSSLANVYITANYTCITIVHHVTGEKIQFFLTFETWDFFS